MKAAKLIRNEQIVRDQNRSAGHAIKKYFGPKKEIIDSPVEFICECSDINCKQPVKVTIAEYERLHKLNNRFLIVKGHKEPAIEDTVKEKGNLELVEKPDLAP